MTAAERLQVAIAIVAEGGLAVDVARSLKLNGRRARQLHDRALQHVSPPPRVVAPCIAEKHGTANAYRNQGCRCETARRANTRYNKLREAGLIESGWVSSLGVVRRRRALGVMGYGWAELSAHYGCAENVMRGHLDRPTVRRTTFRRWAQMYDQLAHVRGPNENARRYALRAGWAPPAAWDNIDDPRERPKGVRKEAA